MTDERRRSGTAADRRPTGRGLARGVALAVGFVVFAVVVMGAFLGRFAVRLRGTEKRLATAEKELTTAREVLEQVNTVAGVVLSNQDGIRTIGEAGATAARNASAAAERSEEAARDAKVAAEFLTGCFTPTGRCTEAARRSQAFIEAQAREVVAQVGRLTFVVTEVRPGVFEARPAGNQPQGCDPVLRLGQTGVGQGVLCRMP